MLTLPSDRFEKAQEFLFAQGGKIERAWFRYIFEDGDADSFLDVLAQYQYENGGFGGLYHEFDYQGPCLKSTEIAVKYILELEPRPSADHPVIQRLMAYLLENYLPQRGNWREVVVPEVNSGVHCRWVRYRNEDDKPIVDEDERIRKYSANEKACFAAFVSCYAELAAPDLYQEIIRYPVEHIVRHWDKDSPAYLKAIFDDGEPYDIEYFQWLVPFLRDRAKAAQLAAILCQNPTAFMELDFARSANEYVHLPCDVVFSPDSILYPAVRPLVEQSLDVRIRQQAEDGRWPLGWSFGDNEGLQRLQVKYEAYRTLLMLVKLKRFGRLESDT